MPQRCCEVNDARKEGKNIPRDESGDRHKGQGGRSKHDCHTLILELLIAETKEGRYVGVYNE